MNTRVAITTAVLAAVTGAVALAITTRGDDRGPTERAKTDTHEHAQAGHGHDHSTPRPKQIDPGPRLLSAAERTAEVAAAERAIGPEPDLGEIGVDQDGKRVLKLKDGGYRYSVFPEPHRRKLPHVMAPLEVETRFKTFTSGIHDAMDHSIHHRCANELYRRNPFRERLLFSLIMHIGWRGDTLVIDDVEPLGGSWPEAVDQEAQQCYVSAFRGVEMAAPANDNLPPGGFFFEWPICINLPAAPAGDARLQEQGR